jgi:hypothetical protein
MMDQLYINYKILLNIYNKNQINKIKKSIIAFFLIIIKINNFNNY